MHQLLGFPGLAGAALYRRAAVPGDARGHAGAPDLLCLYDFGDAATLEAYEASAVKRAAEHDRQLGWGRDGIVICLRAPYERLYGSARDDASTAEGPARCRVTALSGSPSAAAERALAAGAFERAATQHLALRAVSADGYLWMESGEGEVPALAPPHGLAAAWSGDFVRLHAWCR